MAGLPGYPSNQQLAAQAASAAGAAVPTLQSINQQYGQSMADTRGFTNALVSLLRGGPNPGAGYMNAEAAQAGIDNAAASRLAALGGQYGAQSAAAVHGMGDSALGGLLQRGAAASAYGAKMPAVAAGRGQLLQQGLVTAKNQAITQRGQQYAQAYQQALQQARQNGLAISQLGLSQKQLAFQEQTQNQNNAYRYAALAQNQAQFTSSQRQQLQEFLAQQQQAITSATKSGLGNFTPSEIATMAREGQQQADNFTTDGVPIQRAIQQLAVHMPLQLAQHIALVSYANLTKPEKGNPIFHKTVNGQDKFNQGGYNAALNAYRVAYSSWKSFLHTQRAFVRQRAVRRNPNATNQRNPNPGGVG